MNHSIKESGDVKSPALEGASPAPEGADPLGSNSQIGQRLKQYYDELVSEEVPDRFADLLRRLEQTQKG